MSHDEVTITLPFSAHGLGTILLAFSVLLMSVIVYFALERSKPSNWLTAMQDRMGLAGLHPVLVLMLAAVWAALFLALLIGIFWVLFGIVERSSATSEEEGRELRWYLLTLTAITASLGAVISLPFTLIRVMLNRRQTETAEQGHITDRINTAVQGLGAEKIVTQQKTDAEGNLVFERDSKGKPIIEKPVIVTETQPNLEVRIGAIYALERIAQDSDRDHVQIMEILCAYIRENAPAQGADPWPELEMREGEQDGPLKEDWKERLLTFKEDQNARIQGLSCRTDIQVTLEVIGRRTKKQRQLEARSHKDDEAAGFVFDEPCPDPEAFLPKEGYDPKSLEAYRSKLRTWQSEVFAYKGYRLDLRGANLRGADFSGLNLNGARFDGSQMQGANLRDAELQGAILRHAELQGAVLTGAKLQGAVLWNAKLQGANAKLQAADLTGAKLQGADLWDAELQGAHLWNAKLQRAVLGGAKLDSDTSLKAATLRGAALRDVDFTDVPQIAEHLEEMFGDGSVTLPGGHGPGHESWPGHWPSFAIENYMSSERKRVDLFNEEWQEWQNSPDKYAPPTSQDEAITRHQARVKGDGR